MSIDIQEAAPHTKNEPGTDREHLNQVLQLLAVRAKARRIELGLNRSHLASLCDLIPATLSLWEHKLPTKRRDQEAAWERALAVPAGWLRDESLQATPVADLPPATTPAEGTALHAPKLTDVERHMLGERAKLRRTDLAMSREYVAAKAGTQFANLVIWERMLPAVRRSVEENWEAALQVPPGWLRDLSIVLPDAPPVRIFQIPAEETVAAEIRRIGIWTTRKRIYNRTFQYDDLSAAEKRLADIFALRYGVDGEEMSILNAIGDRYGLTRERIRQITASMTERVAGNIFDTPKFDELIKVVKTLLPCRLDELDVKLRTVLGESLSLESADRFAREILGKAIAVVTDRPADMSLAWDKVVIAAEDHDAEALRAVREAARGMIRSTGAAHIYFVAGAAGKILGRGISQEKVLQCCKVISGFEWIIETDGWFWFGLDKIDNRLLPIAQKVLAIATRSVDGEDIHAALVRSRRDHYNINQPRPYLIEPTIDVVIEILRRLPGVRTLQSNNFRLESPLLLNEVLSETEMEIYDCLIMHGGVASTNTLKRELIETGRVKHISLHVSLNSTPIVLQVDYGLYALRGYSLNPESLAEEAASVGVYRTSAVQRLQKLGDDMYVVEFELSQYMLQTRFFSVASALASILSEGDYQIDGTNSTANYVILPSGAKRLRQLINKIVDAGFSEGETVRLVIYQKLRLLQLMRSEAITSTNDK